MGRLRQAIAALRSNRGSGMVMVIITMMFVLLLGSALLYSSYTSYLVRMADRAGKVNFYDASTAMDQVTAGIQEQVSDAIAEAYTHVLTQYSSLDDPKTVFEDEFARRLLGDSTYALAGGDASELIWQNGASYSYSSKGLLSFVSAPAGAVVTLNGVGDAESDSEVSGDLMLLSADGRASGISFQNISLTYVQKGYETNVTTDIRVDVPDFYQSAAEYAVSGLPDYALIAKSELQSSGSRSIHGSAYAGTARVQGGTLALQNGVLISPGAIRLSDGTAAFTVAEGSSIWARDLIAGGGTRMTLEGKAYIANDLVLNRASHAKISGEYYGFGMHESDPDESSAILSNGTAAALDLTGASRLFLAGNSFISAGTSSTIMGESVSAKVNQLIYLIPDAYLTGDAITSNPQIVSGTVGDLTGHVSLPSELDASVQQLLYPLSGGRYVVYFFMKFDTPEKANAYFRQYFASNQAQIASYMEKYMKITGEAGLLQTRGHAIMGAGDDVTLHLADSASSIQAISNRLSGFYKNLCGSLTTTISTASNPYDYYVNTAKVAELSGSEEGGVTVGGTTYRWLVTPGDYTVNGGDPYSVIIARGPVTVNADFEGLILSGGDIILHASAKAGEHIDNILPSIGDYLTGYVSESTEAGEKKHWNLNQLVYYQNWKRH